MAPGGAKRTAEIEAAPVIGLCGNTRRLERGDNGPFIGLGAHRKRQRNQPAAANEPGPHPSPHTRPPRRRPLRSRSPASRGGTQAERKNYAELVTIVQNTGREGRGGSPAAVNTWKRKSCAWWRSFFRVAGANPR